MWLSLQNTWQWNIYFHLYIYFYKKKCQQFGTGQMWYIQTKFNKCIYVIYFLHLDVFLPRHLVEPFYNS